MLSPLRLTQLRRVAEVVAAPDGPWLAASVARLDDDDAGYVHDLWRVPFDGSPTRLTSGPWNDRSPRFGEAGLFFLSNRPAGKTAEEGETDRAQVWLLPREGGEPRRITDEPLGVAKMVTAGGRLVLLASVLPGVAPEVQRETAIGRAKRGPSALRYRAMPVRHWDHWEPEAEPHLIVLDDEGRRDLTPDIGRALRPDPSLSLSADGAILVVQVSGIDPEDRVRSTWPRRFDLRTGESVDLAPNYRGSHEGILVSPSGRRVVALRSSRPADGSFGHRELVVYEGDGERVVAGQWDRWPYPQAFLDEDRLLVRFDEGGEVRVAVVDLRTERVELVEVAGSHECLRVAPDGTVVGVAHSLDQPPRPFRLEGAERAWLSDLSGWSAAEREGWSVDRFTTRASDGASIDTRLVKPDGPGPHPTVLWIHGGPISHFGDQWHWRWNPLVLVRAGYAVALPNARGSTGYGARFVEGIWGNQWGAQCFDDLMRVTDELAARDDVAADRMAAMGGSFGGYMTNWIGGHTDRFAALVTHASVFDFRSFYGTTDLPAYWALHNASTPWRGDIDRYSPHTGAPRWKTPTLILHGERDYRVPIGEALALFEALQLHGVPSELVVFPDENHWITKPRNIRAWYDAVLEFLGDHLKA